jgi:hypothetical protein
MPSSSTPTTEPATTVSPNDARRLVAAALQLFVHHWTDQLEARAIQLDIPAINADLDLASVLADNVTGWTHTTRLREFLETHGDALTAAAADLVPVDARLVEVLAKGMDRWALYPGATRAERMAHAALATLGLGVAR